MAFISLALPPGIYRAGTQYQSQGRWHDGNLVRFYGGTIQPIGGWRVKSTSAMTGAPRAILAWRDNEGTSRTAIATHSHIYYMTRGGVLSDITPTGFTAGRADAVAEGGYGDDLYGDSSYGSPRPDTSQIQDATIASLDNWGEDLVFVSPDDTTIYQWNLDPGVRGAAVANAPSATALIVTQEGILMALGAEGVARRVKWSDQRDNTLWTADATNQAGDFDLQTNGRLMMGLRITGGLLLFTELDVHLATYTADNRIYAFDKKSDGCGAISRAAGVGLDSRAVWMGASGFWLYNGFVQPLACDVSDYVFSDLNYQQQSKVTCEVNSEFGEVTWRYPSGAATEIDRYVTWNFREDHWTVGHLSRLCGADKGVTQYPLRCDLSGNVYEHEVGFGYDTGMMPFLESGPFQLGQGDGVMYANLLLPDDKTVGDVSASFFVKFEPDGVETAFGPYALSSRTDLRFGGRQMRVRYDGVNQTSWRIGMPRLDVTPGGQR
jgi:hypothetical protein